MLAKGDLLKLKPFEAWTQLTLKFEGLNVTAIVNGEQVASAAVTSPGGMIALTSSWDEVEFDNFTLVSSNTTAARGYGNGATPEQHNTKNAFVSSSSLCDNSSLSGVRFTFPFFL